MLKNQQFSRHPEEITGGPGAPISAPKDGPLGPSWVEGAAPLLLNQEEQEQRLRQLAVEGDAGGIRRLLESPVPGFDINAADKQGCSALFLALKEGQAKKNPQVVSLLMANGALIKNGPILPPHHLPKLLTQHAGAQIILQVINSLSSYYGASLSHDLILEVGSGGGYLKYLLSLLQPQDPFIEDIKNRLVETDLSADLVYNNLLKGKHTINNGISQLGETFGDKVFADIKASHRDSVLFPYYKNGKLGLRIGFPNDSAARQISAQFPGPGDWCDLFMKNPLQYIETANAVTGVFDEKGTGSAVILFRDFFIEKVKEALARTGFRSIYQEEMSASCLVPRNSFHRQIPGADYFENNLELIITDTYGDISQRQGEDRVLEKSTFFILIAQKVVGDHNLKGTSCHLPAHLSVRRGFP